MQEGLQQDQHLPAGKGPAFHLQGDGLRLGQLRHIFSIQLVLPIPLLQSRPFQPFVQHSKRPTEPPQGRKDQVLSHRHLRKQSLRPEPIQRRDRVAFRIAGPILRQQMPLILQGHPRCQLLPRKDAVKFLFFPHVIVHHMEYLTPVQHDGAGASLHPKPLYGKQRLLLWPGCL